MKWMQEHIQILEEEVKKLKENVKMDYQTDPEVPENIVYTTDEDELARETEWLRVKGLRKKRKLNNTPSPPKSKETKETKSDNEQKLTKKMSPPPSVLIVEMKDYDSLYEKIKTIIPKNKFKTKFLDVNNVKINVEDSEMQKDITKMLNEDKHAWHTYENKQTRPIRVMAKNLHRTCKPEKIIDDLRSNGFKATEASIKMKLRNKEPLNMFMLTFSSEENIENIYQIKNILGCKVDIQPLRKSKLIPQCKKCQSYGHTQAYCFKEPRCVKFLENTLRYLVIN